MPSSLFLVVVVVVSLCLYRLGVVCRCVLQYNHHQSFLGLLFLDDDDLSLDDVDKTNG